VSNTVLFVDDETGILNAMKRLFAEDDVEVVLAESAASALEVIRSRQVSVIVSDNLMPNMNGIEFLQRARQIVPDSIRILLTGYADMRSAIDAINKGEVYRFITKPWDNDDIKTTVLEAVNRFNVVTAMRGANEATLLSLAQTIELKDPYTRGHCDRVAKYAVRTAEMLGLSAQDRKHIEYGSWLHDCGKIGVPESILNFNGPITDEQMQLVKNHTEWGAEVARLARLPEMVVDIILYHHEKYDGTGYPRGLRGEEIPYHARIVTIADFYDALASDRPYRKAMSREKAFEILDSERGIYADPTLLDIFTEAIKGV
jgi:putative nucleotidyltransferase with HDIG domain